MRHPSLEMDAQDEVAHGLLLLHGCFLLSAIACLFSFVLKLRKQNKPNSAPFYRGYVTCERYSLISRKSAACYPGVTSGLRWGACYLLCEVLTAIVQFHFPHSCAGPRSS